MDGMQKYSDGCESYKFYSFTKLEIKTLANAGDTGCQQTPAAIECGAVDGWQQLFSYSSFSHKGYNSCVAHTCGSV